MKRRIMRIVRALGLMALWIGSGTAIAAPKVASNSSQATKGNHASPLAELEAQSAALNELGGLVLDRVGRDSGKALLYVEKHGKKLQGAIFRITAPSSNIWNWTTGC